MTTFNKSEIVKDAWERYHSPFLFRQMSGRKNFVKCLKAAWKSAKAMIESRAIKAFYQAQSIACQSMSQIELLREEISMLPFKSSRIDIADRRAHLEAQIERLAA